MERFSALAPVLLVLAWAGASHAAPVPPPCPEAVYRQADAALAPVETWSALHAYYARYGACRDGYLGEATSEKVEHLLSDRWKALPELADIVRSDRGFERFVLDQLGETNSAGFDRELADRGARDCPKGAEGLCRRLVVAAKD